jgi:hypothetical protein
VQSGILLIYGLAFFLALLLISMLLSKGWIGWIIMLIGIGAIFLLVFV